MAKKKLRKSAFVPRLLVPAALMGVVPACALMACGTDATPDGTSGTTGASGSSATSSSTGFFTVAAVAYPAYEAGAPDSDKG